MESANRSPGLKRAVTAVASSTAVFTLVCFALAMMLLMSQPPDVAFEDTSPAGARSVPGEDLSMAAEKLEPQTVMSERGEGIHDGS
jgi:hypothetical protein